jgi:CRISPR system Cascade subunit CasC
MTMLLELHLITRTGPSNLNRDEAGLPKDCWFGGYRRGRISSQCYKQATRRAPAFERLLEQTGAAVRTRWLVNELAARVATRTGWPMRDVAPVVERIFTAAGLPTEGDAGRQRDRPRLTRVIVTMDVVGVDRMAAALEERWDAVAGGEAETVGEVADGLAQILAEAVHTPEIALFGRMLEANAATPVGRRQMSVEAATQWAHAVSTHAMRMESDFFSALDTLAPDGSGGAMLGEAEFNACTYYRYVNCDLTQLRGNLGDEALLRPVTAAFLEAAALAMPDGKAASFATPTPPDLLFAVARPADSPGWSLLNAFEEPVRVTREQGLLAGSALALWRYWGDLIRFYGPERVVGGRLAMPRPVALEPVALEGGAQSTPPDWLDSRGLVRWAPTLRRLIDETLALANLAGA